MLLAQVDVEELEERHEREQRELEAEIDELRSQLYRVEQEAEQALMIQQRAPAEPDWRAKLRTYELKVDGEKGDGGK